MALEPVTVERGVAFPGRRWRGTAADQARRYARLIGSLILLIAACDRQEPAGTVPATAESPTPAPSVRPADLLIFPVELHVPDESVNVFVERAMTACSTGNYEEFRRLWSAQRDPLPRSEFEQGWQAVKTIRVRALQKIILAQAAESVAESGAPPEAESRTGGDQVAYALLADLSLDPKHPAGQDQPNREAALLIVRERDDWCLTKAPKQVRDWVKEHFVAPPPASRNETVDRTRSGAVDRDHDAPRKPDRSATSPNP